MNRNRSSRRLTAHQDQILDLVTDYRYLAPAKLALDEAREQLLAAAALDRLLPPADSADRQSSPMEAVRHRLGGLLIRLGTNLRDAYAVEPDIPTTSGAAASGVGR